MSDVRDVEKSMQMHMQLWSTHQERGYPICSMINA